MQNKGKLTAAIVLVLLMTSVTLMANMAINPTQAQNSVWLNETREPPAGVTPFWTQESKAYISFHPNVLGLGQGIILNGWVSPSMDTNRRFMNNITKAMLITLEKPDGTKVELYLPNANSEATSWTTYTVDQVGVWKAKFTFFGTFFPQQNITGGILRTLWLKPSETGWYSFTVQTDLVSSWPPSPLPTGYWEWPVDFHNREWWTVTGVWPGTAYDAGDYASYFNTLYPDTNPYYNSGAMFEPFVTGPNSAHVMRKKTEAIGGMYGGAAGITGQFADAGYPSVVYHGRCYDTVTKLAPVLINGTYRQQPTNVATCFDLRTGEVYYDIPEASGGVTPTYVGYDQGGSTQSDVQTFTPELFTISSNRLLKINPFTGAVATNVSLLYSGSNTTGLGTGATYISQVDEIFWTIQDLGAAAANATGGRYRLINWTTVGTSSNYATRIFSNTSYASSSLATTRDMNAGLGASTSSIEVDSVRQGQNVTGYNLYTGQVLWSRNISEPRYTSSGQIADHGKLAMLSMYGKFVGLDLTNGATLWETQVMNFPFGASAFGVYGMASAYGLFFRPGYDGLWAFNWTDGSTAWYTSRMSKAPFESTYTNYTGGSESYPGQTQVRIADGKVFIYDGEHSPQQPRTRGWSLYAFDVYTGKKIWELAIGGSIMFSSPPSIGPIIDGYLFMPATNGVTYIIGIGKSATTAKAEPKVISEGSIVNIEGTVLDTSPAQPGTPAVSKDSMTTQMNYLHLQYPIDGIWHNETITGVPVALSAIGEDGTYYDIGTTTTDGYYGTFAMAWIPPKQGTYKIIADFAGDESYAASGAATSITVGPKAETSNGNTGGPVTTTTDFTPLYYGVAAAAIAIILAVAIVGILLYRKRP
mgnify:CR=1 FL=1